MHRIQPAASKYKFHKLAINPDLSAAQKHQSRPRRLKSIADAYFKDETPDSVLNLIRHHKAMRLTPSSFQKSLHKVARMSPEVLEKEMIRKIVCNRFSNPEKAKQALNFIHGTTPKPKNDVFIQDNNRSDESRHQLVTNIMQLLLHKEHEVRDSGLELLFSLRDKQITVNVIQKLTDNVSLQNPSSKGILSTIAEILGRQGTNHEIWIAVSSITSILEFYNIAMRTGSRSEHGEIKNDVINLLMVFFPEQSHDIIWNLLNKSVTDSDQERYLRKIALLKNPASIPKLTRILLDNSERYALRSEAAKQLISFHHSNTLYVFMKVIHQELSKPSGLRSSGYETQLEYKTGNLTCDLIRLSRFFGDARMVPVLLNCLYDWNEKILSTALKALGYLRDPRAIEAIYEFLEYDISDNQYQDAIAALKLIDIKSP
jgi:hypothetical protein